MTYDDFHKSVFRKNPKYKEKFELFEAKEREADTLDTPKYRHQQTPTKDYYTLVVFGLNMGMICMRFTQLIVVKYSIGKR